MGRQGQVPTGNNAGHWMGRLLSLSANRSIYLLDIGSYHLQGIRAYNFFKYKTHDHDFLLVGQLEQQMPSCMSP